MPKTIHRFGSSRCRTALFCLASSTSLGLRERAVGEVGRRRAARELVRRDADAAVLDHRPVGRVSLLPCSSSHICWNCAGCSGAARPCPRRRPALARGRQVLVEPVADPREHAAPDVAVAQRGDCRAIARRALHASARRRRSGRREARPRTRPPPGRWSRSAWRRAGGLRGSACAGSRRSANVPTRGSRAAIFSASFAL